MGTARGEGWRGEFPGTDKISTDTPPLTTSLIRSRSIPLPLVFFFFVRPLLSLNVPPFPRPAPHTHITSPSFPPPPFSPSIPSSPTSALPPQCISLLPLLHITFSCLATYLSQALQLLYHQPPPTPRSWRGQQSIQMMICPPLVSTISSLFTRTESYGRENI